MHRLAGITKYSIVGLNVSTQWRRPTSCLLLVGLLFASSVQANTELERKVKVAFIYNFAKFIDWPPQSSRAGNDFVICVAGQSSLGEVINNTLENRPIKNGIINVRNIGWSIQELDSCQILYVNDSDTGAAIQLLTAAAEKPILTISESSDFVQKGGIIQLMLVGDKIGFSINHATAVNAGLNISAKLLAVAYRVIRVAPGNNVDSGISELRHDLLS
jgi:hypothetical protein